MFPQDLLFNQIYQKFSLAGGASVLLDLLEPFILNNRLDSLPHDVLQKLAQHYKPKVATSPSLLFSFSASFFSDSFLHIVALASVCL